MNAQNSADNAPIDRHLGAFFSRELPSHWPACPRLDNASVSKSSLIPKAQLVNRAVLAASIALLALLGFSLSGRMPSPQRTAGNPNIDAGTANLPKHMK